MDGFKKALGGLMIGLLKFPIRVGLGLYRAYVLTVLWAWFAVPQFGYRPLPLVAAYGLLLIAGLFYRISESDEDARKQRENVFAMDIAFGVVSISMIWGVGWLTHHFFS